MSEIITLASGLEQVGKTHLGINIALELARRGHGVGYYHEGGGPRSLNQLLQLRQRSPSKHPDRKTGVTCHGYQGVDIIASRIPLSRWNSLDRDDLTSLVASHEVWSGYDDFVIDTSGMSPRAVVACCSLSRLVLLVVTPAPESQAGALALLRILHLNACNIPVMLVVNQVNGGAQAAAIHARFSEKARHYLGLEVPLLAAVVRDDHVQSAMRHKQTFTSMFPESMVAGCVVKLVEELLVAHAAGGPPDSGLSEFWGHLAENMHRPVRLPGNANLADFEPADEVTPLDSVQSVVDDIRAEATLLRYEGPLGRLGSIMENFSGVMHFLANDMEAFHDRLEDVRSGVYEGVERSLPDCGILEMTLASILDTLRHGVSRQQQICFQVEEDPVSGTEAGWLAPGYYIKYVLVLPGQDDIIERVRQEMERVPGLRLNKGHDGECICEVISSARDACLSVIHTPQGEIRVNYWHRPDRRKSLRAEESAKEIPSGRGLGSDCQPSSKLLH
jgi:MinD-like ATPase involved in chromosome partitioning or flagellar assembly